MKLNHNHYRYSKENLDTGSHFECKIEFSVRLDKLKVKYLICTFLKNFLYTIYSVRLNHQDEVLDFNSDKKNSFLLNLESYLRDANNYILIDGELCIRWYTFPVVISFLDDEVILGSYERFMLTGSKKLDQYIIKFMVINLIKLCQPKSLELNNEDGIEHPVTITNFSNMKILEGIDNFLKLFYDYVGLDEKKV